MSLFQLLYQSRALVPFEPADLLALLRQSRAHNRAHGITGLLLLTPDGRFVQLLEGPREAVRELYYHRIVPDPRHFSCNIISEGPCLERCFADWHMAFRPAQAAALRHLLAPVPPVPRAALRLPRPHSHAELLVLLLDFMTAAEPVPGLE